MADRDASEEGNEYMWDKLMKSEHRSLKGLKAISLNDPRSQCVAS